MSAEKEHDRVNHPSHYTSHPSGVECLTVARHMGFNLGNAMKYIWRAGLKGSAVEDLKKARFYLDDEITRLEGDVPLTDAHGNTTTFVDSGDGLLKSLEGVPRGTAKVCVEVVEGVAVFAVYGVLDTGVLYARHQTNPAEATAKVEWHFTHFVTCVASVAAHPAHYAALSDAAVARGWSMTGSDGEYYRWQAP